jgi:hypothetical protein
LWELFADLNVSTTREDDSVGGNSRGGILMKALLRPWSAMIGCLLLLALLAGCAPGTNFTASPPNSPTGTATTAASGTPELNGCKAANPPASAGRQADVVVTFQGGAEAQTVTLNTGQTLEVRLPANMRWSLETQGDATVLTPSADNDWYDAGLHSCVWRFVAANQGKATLSFGGVMVCQPNTACSHLAAAQKYAITVR